MKANFKAPHKSIQSPLGHAVPIKGTSGHWCYTPPKGRRKKNTVQPSIVSIMPANGGWTVKRASADKTIMAIKPTFPEAKRAAYQMGYRFYKGKNGDIPLTGE